MSFFAKKKVFFLFFEKTFKSDLGHCAVRRTMCKLDTDQNCDRFHLRHSHHCCSRSENLFGTYYEKGDLIAKSNLNSVEEPDDPLTNANRYVLADITSFFTLLVGIYFPSVTGERLRSVASP